MGFAEADINRPGILPDSWGFSAAPTLQQLKQPPNSHQAETSREGQRRLYPNADTESYVSLLQSDHAFISNHSVHAMAEAYGVSQVAASLSGSLLAGTFDSRAADAAVQAIRQQVDSAWSAEAVRQGVGCAKAGVPFHTSTKAGAAARDSTLAVSTAAWGCSCKDLLHLQMRPPLLDVSASCFAHLYILDPPFKQCSISLHGNLCFLQVTTSKPLSAITKPFSSTPQTVMHS